MLDVADTVHKAVAAIVLLMFMVAMLLRFAPRCFAKSISMSEFRTTTTSDQTRDFGARYRRALVRDARRSWRGNAVTSSAPRYEQPIARARSPCRAGEAGRCSREPASHRCITSEGQLLIIRTVTKFNRSRDIAAMASHCASVPSSSRTSHTRAVLSPLAVTTRVPSGLNAALPTFA